MKNKKNFIILLLVAVCCINFSHCSGKDIEPDHDNSSILKKKDVYFITKSTGSSFWQSVYAGASAAGTEYNMNLFFEGPNNEEDYITQNMMIKSAIHKKADAIIISAVDYKKNARFIDEAAKKGIQILAVDSAVDSDHVKCYIGTDNYDAGKKAGQSVLKVKVPALNIGIVNFDKTTENGQSREKGFRDAVMKDHRCKIVDSVNISSSVEEAKNKTTEMIKNHPEINAIVAFNEIISLGAGQAIEEAGVQDQIKVVAFDSHADCIDFLEKGIIDSLIVQNPYAMGYLGMENAYKLLNGEKSFSNIDTEVSVITKENMYSEESQRILFDFE